MGESFFGTTFDCTCGRTHRILPRRSFYCADAAGRLAEACAELTAGRRVILLMDARTRAAAGDDVAAAFADAGWTPLPVIVPDPARGKSPVCDDHTRQSLDSQLPPADLICPVGAGVINDLGKWAAADRGLPHVTFATAASMNGYTSANIAPTIGGIKRLLDGQAPQLVAASPAVLAAAPHELTASGLGDVLAKSVSSADWWANHLLFGEYYCPKSVGLIEEIEPLYLDRPEDLRDKKPEAFEALFSALLLTGVAMTMAETSFPSSGGEHLIGHALDMMSSADGVPHDLHGRQVGVGTILASELYRRVLAAESPILAEPAEGIDRAFWGPLADAVEAEYVQKVPRLREAREIFSSPRLRGDTGGWRRPDQEPRPDGA